jgi:hypothetical protein
MAVSFSSGLAFQFNTLGQWGIAVTALCDASLKGNLTHGLLGVYDGNPYNDLQTPVGNVLPANSTTEQIHYKFGMTWRVDESESLFNYLGKNYSFYDYPDYKPTFGFSPGQLPAGATDVCGDDFNCLFDFVYTGSATAANHTLTLGEQYNDTVKTVRTCLLFLFMFTFLLSGVTEYITMSDIRQSDKWLFSSRKPFTRFNSRLRLLCGIRVDG